MTDCVEEGESSTSVKKFGEFTSMEDFTKVIFIKFIIHAFTVRNHLIILGWHETNNGCN